MPEIPISQITVPPDRQRQTISEEHIEKLADSIRLVGLIHPIVLDESNTLISGECRLKAHQFLGRTHIEYRSMADLEDWEKDFIELEENIRRLNINHVEELMAKERLHLSMQKRFGKKQLTGRESKFSVWKLKDSAEHLGISVGQMSQDLQLAKAIKQNPDFADTKKFKSKSALVHAYQRDQEVKGRMILAALSKEKPEPDSNYEPDSFVKYTINEQTLYMADCLEVIPQLQDDSIHCLITDPPWQVMADDGFGSDPTTGLELTKQMLEAVYPKLQTGSLCWLFCASKHILSGAVQRIILSLEYRLYQQFFIWYKPTIAASSHPYRELKNDYEPALLFSKDEGRLFQKPSWAVFSHMAHGKKLHPAEKPVEVIKHLIELSTVKGETVFDPFAGSARTLAACMRTKRKGIGIELQQKWYDVGIVELDNEEETIP